MGWRFRRSINIAPGIRATFGKSGFSSFSVGGRGARATIAKRGVTHTFGLPGTSLSFHTADLDALTASSRVLGPGASKPAAAPPLPDRFDVTRELTPRRNGYVPTVNVREAGR